MGGVQESFHAVGHALFSAGVHLAGWLAVDALVPTNISEGESVTLKLCLLCLLGDEPLHLWVILHDQF